MPYRKKYYKKKYRKKSSFNSRVQRLLYKNIETKERAYNYTDNAITDQSRGGWKIDLTGIAQGDSQTGRIGNQIRVTGFHCDMIYKASDATNVIRFLLVIPHSALDPPNPTPFSLLDLDRYTILMDEKIPLVKDTARDNVRRVFKRSFTRGGKSAGILVRYKGAGSTDLTKNQIYAIWMSDSAAINDPTISGTMRMYYKDA